MSRVISLACLLSFVGSIGCGGGSELQLVAVSGTLKFESGDPVSGATVNFMPEEGGIGSQGTTAEDGTFTLRTSTGALGALAGKHKITVTKESEESKVNWNDPQSMQDMAAKRGGGGGRQKSSEPNGARANSDGSIPKQYQSTSDTPLSYDVTKDGSHSSVELVISAK